MSESRAERIGEERRGEVLERVVWSVMLTCRQCVVLDLPGVCGIVTLC